MKKVTDEEKTKNKKVKSKLGEVRPDQVILDVKKFYVGTIKYDLNETGSAREKTFFSMFPDFYKPYGINKENIKDIQMLFKVTGYILLLSFIL